MRPPDVAVPQSVCAAALAANGMRPCRSLSAGAARRFPAGPAAAGQRGDAARCEARFVCLAVGWHVALGMGRCRLAGCGLHDQVHFASVQWLLWQQAGPRLGRHVVEVACLHSNNAEEWLSWPDAHAGIEGASTGMPDLHSGVSFNARWAELGCKAVMLSHGTAAMSRSH